MPGDLLPKVISTLKSHPGNALQASTSADTYLAE